MGTITITSDGLFTRQHLEHARPSLLFAGANVCRRNGDFCDAQTHVQPRAGGVSPPWLGNVRGAEVENPQQTRIRATTQERGASAPRGSPKRIRNATAQLLGTLPTLPRRPRLQ
jgi:hypothetical protein